MTFHVSRFAPRTCVLEGLGNALVVTITAGVVVGVNRVTVSTGSRCQQGHSEGHRVNRVTMRVTVLTGSVSTGSQCQQGHDVNRVTVSTGSRCQQGHSVNRVTVSTGSRFQQGHGVKRVTVSTGSQCQQGHGVWFAGSRDYQAGPLLPTDVWCSISRRRRRR